VRPFDYLLDHQDEYKWDFCQIQMNFLDWRHASMGSGWKKDADAEYLYTKCEKAGVQCVIMEPLRGGAFGRMANELVKQLQDVRPNDSTARWAFRWVGPYPNILTTLSGVNRMDHLKENVETFSPLEVCTEAENTLLAHIADQMSGFPTIPCTTCAYCMPCPYGVDIPGNFAYYNDAVNSHILPLPDKTAADYATKKQQFADGLRQALPNTETWARSCADCEECLPKCPQQIRIPNQMARIVELLRQR
jgi:predicted aldo/keto reductase-like oxidoreductase